jgi:hypothetical protein
MVDKIKFIVENFITDDILQSKKLYTKQNTRKNKEWFVFDYKKLELLHFFRYKNEDNNISNQEADEDDSGEDEKGYLNEEQQFIDKNYKNLSIVFVRNIGEKKGKLIVHQNLRKDYFRVNSKANEVFKDLNYYNFEEIIDIYSKQFKISRPEFWGATKVTKIELGVTLVFNKPNMISIISCFGTCPNLGEKFIYGDSGISYKAENFSISIYDKLKRVLQNKEALNTLSKTRREKFRSQTNKSKYFLRFELKVDSVSKFNQSAFKNKINTLLSIRENWNDIALSLYDLAMSITFVDFLSPEMEKTLLTAKLNDSKSKADFDDFMYYLAIKGLKDMNLLDTHIAKLLPIQIKSGYLKKIEKAYNRFVDMEKNNYRNIYDKKFETNIKKLMKSHI